MNSPLSSVPREEPMAQKSLAILIFTGWAITLAYFPSGILYFYFRNAVYLRELALWTHLIASMLWLYRIGDLRWVFRQCWTLLLIPLFLLPAVADPDYRFEALRTVKWTLFWLDWIFIGHFVFQIHRWNRWLVIFLVGSTVELLLEWLAGFYEWRVGHYLFSTPTTWDEKTMFGVQAVKELTLRGSIRVRGFQRDVFSFANLMGMSSVLGFAWASVCRVQWQKAAGFAWAAFFAVMLVISGGRSAIFGIFASAILAIGYAVDPHFTRKWSRAYLLAWVVVALVISFAGVGELTDAISGTFLGKSHIGDSESAYMRDDNWSNILQAFEQDPIILIIGGPFSSIIEPRIAPMFHWADNQFLWDAYHLGVPGSLAIAFYFFRVIWIGKSTGQPRAVDIICLCLLFVVGEGIARESLTFMGCLPLFVSCGYVSAASGAAKSAPEFESRPRSRRRRRKTVQSTSRILT